MGIDQHIELALLRKENEDLKLNLLAWENEWNPISQRRIENLEHAIVLLKDIVIASGFNKVRLDSILSKFLGEKR